MVFSSFSPAETSSRRGKGGVEIPPPRFHVYFRPISSIFKKETNERMTQHDQAINEEVHQLTVHESGDFQVEYELQNSMLDSKLVCTLTDTKCAAKCNASQRSSKSVRL